MVRVKETMVSVQCSVCGRQHKVSFKDYRAEVDYHKASQSEPFQGAARKWYCSYECREEGRKRWGCPGFYNKKGRGRPKVSRKPRPKTAQKAI